MYASDYRVTEAASANEIRSGFDPSTMRFSFEIECSCDTCEAQRIGHPYIRFGTFGEVSIVCVPPIRGAGPVQEIRVGPDHLPCQRMYTIDRGNGWITSSVDADGSGPMWGLYSGRRNGYEVAKYVIEEIAQDWPEHPYVPPHAHTLVMRYQVCPVCDGRGTHVNPSIDCGGLSSEDFADDPGFRDDYFGGSYDVTCYTCRGNRVVPEPDTSACDPEALAAWNELESDRAAYEAERAAERRMGC